MRGTNIVAMVGGNSRMLMTNNKVLCKYVLGPSMIYYIHLPKEKVSKLDFSIKPNPMSGTRGRSHFSQWSRSFAPSKQPYMYTYLYLLTYFTLGPRHIHTYLLSRYTYLY